MLYLLLGGALASDSLLNEKWVVVNDTVMGGRSSSVVEQNDGLQFSGNLSLENNGGFASIRTQSTLPVLVGTDGVQLVATSDDGNVYQLVIWMRGYGPRLYYKQDFRPSEDVQELLYSDFVAVSYGRRIQAPALTEQLQNVSSIGIMLSDKQEGPFSLSVTELDTVGQRIDLGITQPMQVALMRAIERGVPLYNGGDAVACAAIYRTVLEDVVIFHQQNLSPSMLTWLERNLSDGLEISDSQARAWHYRRMIDAMLSSE